MALLLPGSATDAGLAKSPLSVPLLPCTKLGPPTAMCVAVMLSVAAVAAAASASALPLLTAAGPADAAAAAPAPPLAAEVDSGKRMLSLYFWRWLLMWKMVRPSTPMIFKMPFGVALSGPPSWFTADTNMLCSSGVQRSRVLPVCRGAGAACACAGHTSLQVGADQQLLDDTHPS
jgi:hypothetical protein